MNPDWLLFVLGVITYQILKMVYLIIDRAIIEHRRKKVVRIVQALFPDNSKITFAAIDASDKRAMAQILKQLEEQGTLTQSDLDYLTDSR